MCFIISYPILLQSGKSVLHALCTQLWKLFSAAPQSDSPGIWREVKTTFTTCVNTGVYRSIPYSHPQNQKGQKVMLSRPAEARNGSLGLRNNYATKELKLWILSLFDWSWALRLTDFVPCCSVGCISWQGNSEENFVNGDQMSKCRLFMDWWAQRQRGKKMNILLFPRHRSFQARLVLKRLKNLSLLSTGLNWSASWLKVLRTMVRVDLDIQTSTTYFNL